MKIDEVCLKSGDRFLIAVDLGANLFSWRTSGREVFYRPDGFGASREDFFKGGNPILFPSVGRTWDLSQNPPVFGQYRLLGRSQTYTMPIHGILPFCSWNKTYETIGDSRAVVEYTCVIPPEVRENHYPFDVEFKIRYTFGEQTVLQEAMTENRGTATAPFAFGLHPYFLIGKRSDVRLKLPCRKKTVLDPKLSISSGKEIPAEGEFSLTPGQTYDCVFVDITGQQASLIDRNLERTIIMEIDDLIQAFVIYSGSECPFICMEPWTKGLGAYSTLNHANWIEQGQIDQLQPGEKRQICVSYRVESC